jgi:predicted phosphodiesterase
MLRSLILTLLFVMMDPSCLLAEKILCISDYQDSGKAATLARLLEVVIANEDRIDFVIVAGDYIVADELLMSIWNGCERVSRRRPLEIFFARGNHDAAAAMELNAAYPMPSDSGLSPIHLPHRKPGKITAHLRKEVLFIVTDPFLSFKRKGYTKWQLDRIEALLSSSSYTHAFVVGHMPAFPKYRNIGKSIDHFPHARDRLVRILTNYEAHLIHGHDHYANLMRVDGSLHIDCGTVNGQYGSAVIIDTDSSVISIRYYEVFMNRQIPPPPLAFQYLIDTERFGLCASDKKHLSINRYSPTQVWGSKQIPSSRQRHVEMGFFESNLGSILNWINYLL